ncbi:MAG: Stage II sporulation protein E (SpoIIE) [Methanoregulaceae archaeon PtaU1.Bin222]|nr:MAG: Stage II sporulation protein E (SpoIIE) [Methanoregulaceae archaeon PtaU1.Bin222]
MFVTLFFCLLDPDKGTITYVNAGHNPPILVRNDGTSISLSMTGMALGVDTSESYEERSLSLCPGDLLVLYTDGVTEAEDSLHRQFGEERLESIARQKRSHSAAEVLATIQSEVSMYTDAMPQYDDMTLVVLKVGS